MSSLPTNQQRSHHHFTHCALHFRHRCCKRRSAVRRWDTQQTYKLRRSRRQHTQHTTTTTTRNGLKRGVTRNVTRKLTRYRDTISLSRDITMMWQRQWWTHYCWEYINNVYNALYTRLPVSARGNINQTIQKNI